MSIALRAGNSVILMNVLVFLTISFSISTSPHFLLFSTLTFLFSNSIFLLSTIESICFKFRLTEKVQYKQNNSLFCMTSGYFTPFLFIFWEISTEVLMGHRNYHHYVTNLLKRVFLLLSDNQEPSRRSSMANPKLQLKNFNLTIRKTVKVYLWLGVVQRLLRVSNNGSSGRHQHW